jgi:hypothetical protein
MRIWGAPVAQQLVSNVCNCGKSNLPCPVHPLFGIAPSNLQVPRAPEGGQDHVWYVSPDFDAPMKLVDDSPATKLPTRKRERDVCQNRHMNNPQSVAAHEKHAGRHSGARAEVYWWFATQSRPASCEEAAKGLGWTINRVSPRISQLKRDRWLKQAGIGRTRGGSACALYVAVTAEERNGIGIQ